MIQANELRIGNYLSVTLETSKESIVRQIGCQDIVRIFEGIGGFKYEPIPITEEWLLKFGWIWNKECKSYEHSDIRMNLEYREMNNSYTMFNYVIKALICKRIYHVHQLQNLYFALTNQELTPLSV